MHAIIEAQRARELLEGSAIRSVANDVTAKGTVSELRECAQHDIERLLVGQSADEQDTGWIVRLADERGRMAHRIDTIRYHMHMESRRRTLCELAQSLAVRDDRCRTVPEKAQHGGRQAAVERYRGCEV